MATDSLCIFAFFGYDTPPPGCDYRAGPGLHANGPGRAQNCGRENGPGRNLIGPGRAVEFRPVQTSSANMLHLSFKVVAAYTKSCTMYVICRFSKYTNLVLVAD